MTKFTKLAASYFFIYLNVSARLHVTSRPMCVDTDSESISRYYLYLRVVTGYVPSHYTRYPIIILSSHKTKGYLQNRQKS